MEDINSSEKIVILEQVKETAPQINLVGNGLDNSFCEQELLKVLNYQIFFQF